MSCTEYQVQADKMKPILSLAMAILFIFGPLGGNAVVIAGPGGSQLETSPYWTAPEWSLSDNSKRILASQLQDEDRLLFRSRIEPWQSKLTVFEVIPCDSTRLLSTDCIEKVPGECIYLDRDSICIDKAVEAGYLVTILGKDGGELCHARTTERITVKSYMADRHGTRLLDFDCDTPEIYSYAILDEDVRSYDKLSFIEVRDPKFLMSLSRKINASGVLKDIVTNEEQLNELTESIPHIEKYPYSDAEVYFAKYDKSPYPLLMIMDEEIFPLSTKKYCSLTSGAFKVNGKYYAVLKAGRCQSDMIWNEYIEIKQH